MRGLSRRGGEPQTRRRPAPDWWGVPDWHGAPAYSISKGCEELLYWAWEFLRRNHDYRTFWKEKCEPEIDRDGGFGLHIDETKRRFGLLGAASPGSHGCAFFVAASIVVARGHVKRDRKREAYVLDLTLPLQPQIARVSRDAKNLQQCRSKKGDFKYLRPRMRRRIYILYLRILDADDAGATAREIGEVLFPKLAGESLSARLRDTRRAARKVRDGGYRALAALYEK